MIDTADFRRLAAVAPQPVALAFARVVRAPTSVEQVDAVRRAAETLTRYVAIAAVSSISSVGDTGGTFAPPDEIGDGKSLAWGYFLDLMRRAAAHQEPHPLLSTLVEGFGLKKGSTHCALDDLNDLLTLRNHRSDHSLVPLNEAKAEVLLTTEQVDQKLLRSAHAFRALLSLPLVVISGSRYENREHVWQCHPYAGADDPFPVDVPGRFEADQRVPYLVLGRRMISLSPGLVWKVDPETYQATFYFLDRLGMRRCGFRSMLVDRMLDLEIDDMLDPAAWLRGDPQPPDSFENNDGRSLGAILAGQGEGEVPRGSGANRPTPKATTPQEPAPSTAGRDSTTVPATHTCDNDRRSRSIDELRTQAELHGLGRQFGQLLDATASAGLLHRPFKHGVMVAPPNHANRFLMWLKIVGNKTPYLKVTGGPAAFVEFFPSLDEGQVRSALGPDRRVHRGDTVDDLVNGLADLFPTSIHTE